MTTPATARRRAAACALVLGGLSAHSLAQDHAMSLEEASYRAGKARIMARYQEDLTTCKGLGNAQARSACAAAAGINRDTARRTLKSGLGPTALGRYLAQLNVEQHPAARSPAPAITRVAARRPMPATVTGVLPAAMPTTRAATVTARAPAAVPAVQAQLATQVATAEASGPVAGVALAEDYSLALKTHYGGN